MIFFMDFVAGFELLAYFKMIVIIKIGSAMKKITNL